MLRQRVAPGSDSILMRMGYVESYGGNELFTFRSAVCCPVDEGSRRAECPFGLGQSHYNPQNWSFREPGACRARTEEAGLFGEVEPHTGPADSAVSKTQEVTYG